MEKMELYHFHKDGDHDKLWQERKEILVPENFKSTTFKRIQNFTVATKDKEKNTKNFYDYIVNEVKLGRCNPQTALEYLQQAFEITFRANEFKREQALENYRLKNNKTTPSRLHSIYLTDEDGIETWKEKFGDVGLTLYRVKAEGEIFKTNEQLIPEEELSYQEVYDKAYYYWNPNFKKVPKDTNEYLVQGKVKILEKIKRI